MARTSRVHEFGIGSKCVESIERSTLSADVVGIDTDRKHHVYSVVLGTAANLSVTEA